MKAFRNVAGSVVEIEVDVGIDGKPILPSDTTVDPKPEALADHYVTVVGTEWVQIPVPVPFVSFETQQQNALAKFKDYRDWYLNSPLEHNGVLFDADDTARNRLTQTLVIYNDNGYLPPFWVTESNGRYPLAVIDDLRALVTAVSGAFSARFYEMGALREQILAATNETELAAITIPSVPNQM